MAIKMAKLLVSLEAENAKFLKGLEQSKRATQNFHRDTKRSLDAITGGFKAMAVAVAGYVSFDFLRNGVNAARDMASEMNNLSKRLGGTAQEWGQLRYAARQADLEMQSITGAITKMQKALADARDGNGAGLDALNALGLSAEKLAQASPSVALQVIADALGEVEDQAKRTQIEMALFGKSGAELAQLLGDGSAGIREMMGEASSLGNVLSQDMVQALGQYESAQKRAMAVSEGVRNQLSARLAPTLSALADFFAEGMPTAINFTIDAFNVLREGAIGAAEAAVRSVAFVTSKIAVAISEFAQFRYKAQMMIPEAMGGVGERVAGANLDAWLNTALSLKAFEGTALQTAEGIGNIELARVGNIQAVGEALESVAAAAPKLDDFRGANDALTNSKKEGAAASREAARAESDLAREMEKQADEAARAAEENARNVQAVYDAIDPTATLRREIEGLWQLLESNPQHAEAIRTRILALEAEIDTALAGVEEQAKEVDTTFADLGATFSSAFEDAIVNGASFRDVLRGIAQDISRIMTRKLITDPLSNWFSNMGTSGGGASFNPLSAVTSFFGGLFRAEGGPVTAGSPYIVGEHGPELFVPNHSGRIEPRVPESAPANVGVRVINAIDPSGFVEDYLGTAAGERAIVNVIRRNRGALR